VQRFVGALKEANAIVCQRLAEEIGKENSEKLDWSEMIKAAAVHWVVGAADVAGHGVQYANENSWQIFPAE
jgi:hypothetical protein